MHLHLLFGLLVFDPQTALQSLEAAGDHTALLATLDDLSQRDLDATPGLGEAVARLTCNAASPLRERLLGARALGRLGGTGAMACLSSLVSQVETPESIALARESARSLARLHAAEALAPAITSADPEVRATAARAGGAPDRLCALLADPWPLVRLGAAHALGGHPTQAACLATALADADGRVQAEAARAAGAARVPTLRTALRTLAGTAQAGVEARSEAFVALAQLDDLEPAERALATHLEKGDIEPLARAAVRALATRGNPGDRARLRTALEAPSVAVRSLAGSALASLGDREALPRMEARLSDTPGLARAVETLRALAPEIDGEIPFEVDEDLPNSD